MFMFKLVKKIIFLAHNDQWLMYFAAYIRSSQLKALISVTTYGTIMLKVLSHIKYKWN